MVFRMISIYFAHFNFFHFDQQHGDFGWKFLRDVKKKKKKLSNLLTTVLFIYLFFIYTYLLIYLRRQRLIDLGHKI